MPLIFFKKTQRASQKLTSSNSVYFLPKKKTSVKLERLFEFIGVVLVLFAPFALALFVGG